MSTEPPTQRAAVTGEPLGLTTSEEFAGYGPDARVDLRRYVAALWRHKWMIALVSALGAVGGFGGSRFVQPEYEAQATIWIEVSGREEARRGPIRSPELLRSSAWVDLLTTYMVLDHVVRDQRLYLRPETPDDSAALATFQLKDSFVPGSYRLMVMGAELELATRSGELLQVGLVGDSVGQDLGFVWLPSVDHLQPDRPIAFAVTNPWDEATRLAEELQTRMDRNGSFLRINLRGTDPGQLASILNAVAERYVEVAADLKGAKLEELKHILNEQLDYAARHLEEAEQALENFRVRTVTLPSEPASPIAPGLQVTRDPAFSNFFDLKFESEQLRRDREAVERVLAEAEDSALSVEALAVIPSVRESTELSAALASFTSKRAEIRALRYRYADDLPPVQRRRAEIEDLERRTIPELGRAVVAELAAREAELQRLIESASGNLADVPTRTIEEARLQRRVAIAENLYTMLQARYEEARLEAASSIPDVRILDAAVAPLRPINKNVVSRIILMALLASAGLAGAGAIVLDRIDPRLRYPDQVRHQLGLPILGTVPQVGNRSLRRGAANTAQIVEAFRVLRLNLLHAYGAAGPVVITITSPAGEDGKSFVASNLGLAFSDQGVRTLVIDGDIRRGRLHRILGGPRKPGLIDLLADSTSGDQVVRQTVHGSLSLIPCGSRRQDGPELLQSEAMAALLARLRPAFDVILIDSPPLAAGVDALALATLTGNLLIVLRTGVTDGELTEAKLDLLDLLPVRILGAVLNAVPRAGAYRRYYCSYLPGYETFDEELPVQRVLAEPGTRSSIEDAGDKLDNVAAPRAITDNIPPPAEGGPPGDW